MCKCTGVVRGIEIREISEEAVKAQILGSLALTVVGSTALDFAFWRWECLDSVNSTDSEQDMHRYAYQDLLMS